MTTAPVFSNANEFSMYIEKFAVENKISHLDAILKYCSDHLIEPEEIVSKINKSLKEKVENDFRVLNYLPKQAQLDI